MKFPPKTPNYIREVVASFIPDDAAEVIEISLTYFYDTGSLDDFDIEYISYIDKRGIPKVKEQNYN